ncbi:hypothetical protein SAMN06266787_1292 [Halorubrum ezzemoulense]|uniref:Uncharacterized protein n=1 Tax=Halorubrum ezzemoulense TaxID=337243 RepID=A0A238Z5L6_HALEZ|nr:hypothetical protein SAMN06266787_1292 [Halorubrum ezzemoulense]
MCQERNVCRPRIGISIRETDTVVQVAQAATTLDTPHPNALFSLSHVGDFHVSEDNLNGCPAEITLIEGE